MNGIKRAAIVFAVVSLLLFADGAYLQASNDNVGGDTGVLFGNPNDSLSAGTVVLISAALVMVGAVIMWAVALRRDRLAGRPGQAAGPGARLAQSQAGARQSGVQKEGRDQR
jgi:hypothetical protein